MERNLIWLVAAGLLLVASLVNGAATLNHLSTVYLPYTFQDLTPQYRFQSDAVENAVYEPTGKLIYAVGEEVMHIIDASNPMNLTYLAHVSQNNQELTDVAVCGSGVFVTYIDNGNLLQGGVLQYGLYNRSTSSIDFIRDMKVGTQPENLLPTKDCTLVVALQNPAVQVGGGPLQDPPGGVGIISFPQGVANAPTVFTPLNFTAFDSRFNALASSGVRWVYRDSSNRFSDDLEPETLTFNADQTKAYVSVQANNAIAVVDMSSRNITALYGLGVKNWTQYALDPSDRDGGINMAPWPVYGMYQPDGIQYFQWDGQEYLITANEGRETKYDAVNFQDGKRGNDFLDSDLAAYISPQIKAALRNDSKLGRLTMSSLDGKNADGQFEKLYTFGARSFSIWRVSDMTQVYDSGSSLADKMKELRPDLFNNRIKDANDKVADGADKRSDDRGVEPGSMAVGMVKDKLLLFVGLETSNAVAVYSLTKGQGIKPRFESLYTDGIPQSSQTWEQLYSAKKLHAVEPGCVRFIGVDSGLADYPILLVTGSDSGTVSLLKVDISGAYSVITGSSLGILLLCLLLVQTAL